MNFRCINNASALYHGRIHPPTHKFPADLCAYCLWVGDDLRLLTNGALHLFQFEKKKQKRRGYEPTRPEVKYLHGTAQRSAWVAVSRVQEERCKSKRNGKEGASAKPPKSDPLETRWTTDGCQQGL